MKAMILAAGLGMRMRPLTEKIPKPLLSVNGAPIIHYTLNFLKKYGITDVVINLHYLADQIKESLGNGSSFGMNIAYSFEPEILGTGGGIKKAEGFLSDSAFVVINSDVFIDVDLKDVLRFHKERNATATMVLRKDENVEKYGAIGIDKENRIRQFLNIIKSDEALTRLMFTGIHILEPKVFDYLPEKGCINRLAYPEMIRKGEHVFGYVMDGYWRDLGTPEAFSSAKKELMERSL